MSPARAHTQRANQNALSLTAGGGPRRRHFPLSTWRNVPSPCPQSRCCCSQGPGSLARVCGSSVTQQLEKRHGIAYSAGGNTSRKKLRVDVHRKNRIPRQRDKSLKLRRFLDNVNHCHNFGKYHSVENVNCLFTVLSLFLLPMEDIKKLIRQLVPKK